MSSKQEALSPGARKLIAQAEAQRLRWQHERLGLHHCLLALLEAHGAMAEGLVAGLDAARYRQELEAKLQAGDLGEVIAPQALEEAIGVYAQSKGKKRAYEQDVAAVLLQKAGWQLRETASAGSFSSASPPVVAPDQATGYQPRAQQPIPTLEKFGRDLTREALEGKLSPIVGREREIQVVIETLCRRTKRNPALIGPAGTGKTAIVEGLAQRIVKGEVPELLKGVRLFAIQPSVLTAGAHLKGELEERVQSVLKEASQDGIVLFIDEMHSMVGMGGQVGADDVASLLKPWLARGEFACIAATTDDEYRRYIEPDGALERRFQPIRINELSRDETRRVLEALLPLFEKQGVRVPGESLAQILDYAERYLRNRYFPDKAVDILEQCVAVAITRNKTTVDPEMVQEVVQRMVGVPLNWEQRMEALPESLRQRGLLEDQEIETLVSRLQITMRGLDLRSLRPNGVLLLLSDEQDEAARLCEALAKGLFGSEERVVSLDLSPLVYPADVTRLIGSPPGYIGYGESTPLHRVAQMPWCVLLFRNIHACHPAIQQVILQALKEGFFTDGRGKRIYLSDSIVVLTAAVEIKERDKIGLRSHSEEEIQERHQQVKELLGEELLEQVDLVVQPKPPTGEHLKCWLRNDLLSQLAAKYHSQGFQIEWEESLVEWLLSYHTRCKTLQDWERVVESYVALPLMEFFREPQKGAQEKSVYRVGYLAEQLQVVASNPSTDGAGSK